MRKVCNVMWCSWGKNIRIRIYGKPHEDRIGVRIWGLPEGMPLDLEELNLFLQRRAPGRSDLSTPRKEKDEPIILSGISAGRLTGGVFEAYVENRGFQSGAYLERGTIPRPGHADFTGRLRYGTREDLRGGGIFSGRMTVAICIAGGICLQILRNRGISIFAHILSVAGEKDIAFNPMGEPQSTLVALYSSALPVLNPAAEKAMEQTIRSAAAAGDSVGGVIECMAVGVPAGLGGAMFDGMEGKLSELLFAIPAVKGVDFGAGFQASEMTGSQNNDGLRIKGDSIAFESNHAGGILGGISSGAPILFRVAVKPTPSITRTQHSVRMDTLENVNLEIKGMHDPCIVPRAVPVVEAALALCLLDALQEREKVSDLPADIYDLRGEIDCIDIQMSALLNRRMACAEKIGRMKQRSGSPVQCPERELAVLHNVELHTELQYNYYVSHIFEEILHQSRALQKALTSPDYALIGQHLGHSLSKKIHESFGMYSYGYRELEPGELGSFLKTASFKGLNITIPYKVAALPFCDALTSQAIQTGCVNTVRREPDGRLVGHNTDLCGFEAMLQTHGVSLKYANVLLLGTGGAAGMIASSAICAGSASVTVLSRSRERGEQFLKRCKDRAAKAGFIPSVLLKTETYEHADKCTDAHLLFNATPVGMWPNNGECLIDLDHFSVLRFVGDLIYNPSKTDLLLRAERLGIPYANGLEMLVRQAAASAEFFAGCEVSEQRINDIVKEQRQCQQNILLVGMPGCGKSTVGKLLADLTGRQYLGLDEIFAAQFHQSAGEYIQTFGERAFRQEEHRILEKISARSGCVIAVGGGCVTEENNIPLMRQNSVVVWLQRDLNLLPVQNRPISQNVGLQTLYERRSPLYAAVADFSVDNNGTLKQTTDLLLSRWREKTE